jgi:dCMP deaminase
MEEMGKTQAGKAHGGLDRPSWDEYFLNLARDVSERATCMSTIFGAIIVKDKRILSTGYNGAPRKTKDCWERGNCLRRELNIPSGHRYELCRSVHAEQNAIINAARAGVSVEGADLYLFGKRIWNGDNSLIDIAPCFICKKIIINAGISRVICSTKEGGIKISHVSDWAEEWKKKDLIDDMDVYDSKYHELKK